MDSTRFSYTGTPSVAHASSARLRRGMGNDASGSRTPRRTSSVSPSHACISDSTSGMFREYRTGAAARLLYPTGPEFVIEPEEGPEACNPLTVSIQLVRRDGSRSGNATTATVSSPGKPPPLPPPPPSSAGPTTGTSPLSRAACLSCSANAAGSVCFAPGSSRTRVPSPSSFPSGRGTLTNSSTSPTAGMNAGTNGFSGVAWRVCVGVYASISENSAFIVGETSKDSNAADARTSERSSSTTFSFRVASVAFVASSRVCVSVTARGASARSGRVSRRVERDASGRASRGSAAPASSPEDSVSDPSATSSS
mmetsp:Transcript_3109/g.12959  ORF Transcript_3109/g.12959 Transcript_3109/m.12959 type:complete len:310 (-) Transcript_3109:45-974(-)